MTVHMLGLPGDTKTACGINLWVTFDLDPFPCLLAGPDLLATCTPCLLELLPLVRHGTTAPRLLRTVLAARDGLHCAYCPRLLTVESLGPWERQEGCYGATIDHVVPKSKGGSDRAHNLVLACGWCNKRKADKMPGEFKPLVDRGS